VFLPCRPCCGEPPCTQVEAFAGGAGTTVTTHTFPSEELELQFDYQAYSVPDEFIVKISGTTVYSTGGQVSGTGKFCFTKPAGVRDVEVTVNGPNGTAWRYTLKCQCEPPPPPPGPCCVFSTPCNDSYSSPVVVGSCTGEQLDCCISEGNSESACIGPTPPPVTECEDSGYETRDSPPYDCIVGPDLSTLQMSLFSMSVPEINSSLGSRPAAWYDSLRAAVESELNGTYVFSSVCVSEVYESFPNIVFDWTEPVIPPSSTGNTYTIVVTLTAVANVCDRSVELTIGVSGAGVGLSSISRVKSAITPTYFDSRCPVMGQNELCNCSNFSGNFDTPSGTGFVDVRKAA